uniref:Uncharacterized protein n=1 Tax=Arundo donax TaxID=35708 RepID=A0A0A9CL22_ARUDO
MLLGCLPESARLYPILMTRSGFYQSCGLPFDSVNSQICPKLNRRLLFILCLSN